MPEKYCFEDRSKWQAVPASMGTITDDGFQLSTNEGDTTLPGCISTFAYWDKSFLQHDQLLNSQTGEYLEVQR